jgi:hypothetical protein
MTENELLALVQSAENDAAIYNGEFMALNEKYLKEYMGELYGDEVEGQSSAVSTDTFDVVEADMPPLMRIFIGSGDVLTFAPMTGSKTDMQEAEEKTKYVNWLIRSQPESFKVIHDWIKDAEIQKNGVVKYFVDEQAEVEEVEYTGLSLEEVIALEESYKNSEVDKIKVELSEETETSEGVYDVKFRATLTDKPIKIINIPPESFLISRNATSVDDAELVGDKIRKTRGQLLAEGYKRELVDRLPSVDKDDSRRGSLSIIRNGDQGGEDAGADIRNWASDYVEISDLYVRVDFDGDGIAERRHIMISGNVVLENESFNHVPYASLSAVLMPHKAIGRSRAEITSPTQKQKTALLRGMFNNIWMVNNPRNVVHGDVDLDDMLTVRTNGIVRLDDDSSILPGQAVFPLQIPYIGDKALQVIQYVDHSRAQSTGANMVNQGLDADSIAKETATRFEGVEKAGEAKLELIARNYAETGFRKLFEGVAWLASRYQDTEREIMVLGKPLTVNPSKWRYKQSCSSQVGLGAGNNEKMVGSLQGIYQIQQQLKATGSLLVDDTDIYNTLKRITDGLGFPSVDEMFNNPSQPEELIQAQNEQMQMMLQQMQQQMQEMQNPLAEAENIKAQAKLIEAQGKGQLEAAKMQEQARQFNAEMEAKQQKQMEDMAAKLTELELKAGQQLDGELQSNMLVFDPAVGDFINA